MMDFYWLWKSDEELILMVHEQEIASLNWNEGFEVWELNSEFLECSMDMDLEYEKHNIDEVQKAAVECLIEHCEEQKEWYDSQIEELKEIQEETSRIGGLTCRKRKN